MQLNYKRLGNYIELVSCINTKLQYGEIDVRGISNNKEIIQTRANNEGREFNKFYVVESDDFIYNSRTSRMGDKVGLGYNDTKKAFITSFNNTVFRVKDEALLPMYLFMWFNRPEFDRYVRFHSWGSSTEIFSWDEMCNTHLPIPSIIKQKEIVKEYNVVQNQIVLNQQLIKKLEETAQAIYKQWFVDFEFPDEKGLPYKSNGGEMIWSEEFKKDIPLGWNIDCLSGIATYTNGLAMQKFSTQNNNFLPVIKIRELTLECTDDSSDKASQDIPKQYIIQNGDILFSWSGTLKVEIWTGGVGGLNQHLFKVTSKKFEKWYYYIWTKFHLKEFKRIAEGKATSLGHIKREHLKDAKVLVPLNAQIGIMNKLMGPILNSITKKKIEMKILKNMNNIILSKLATIEN